MSLRRMLKRVYKWVIWEYKYRGINIDESGSVLAQEVNDNALPYINWRLLMRSYITKLKQRVRATRLQRRVQNTVARGYVNQQSSPTEFYKRLAVGV